MFISHFGAGQKSADTTDLIAELGDVLAYSRRPDIRLLTETKLSASPILYPTDTAFLKGEFARFEGRIYSSNGNDELFVEDSIMVQVNKERKSIWLTKINPDLYSGDYQFNKIDKSVLKGIRDGRLIRKSAIDNKRSKFTVEDKQDTIQAASVFNKLEVLYNNQTKLPEKILITVSMQENLDDNMREIISEECLDSTALIKSFNGKRVVVRQQTMEIKFSSVENYNPKNKNCPLRSAVVQYNAVKDQYMAIGVYRDYEVRKLF